MTINNYYKDKIIKVANSLQLSGEELQRAQKSAKRKIKERLSGLDYIERLQKNFLFDDGFLTSLIKNCTPEERVFMVLYLNRLNMFDNSVELENLINKKMLENKVQTFKGCVIINGVRYDARVINKIQEASTGLLDIDLKPCFYGLQDEELIESCAVFSMVMSKFSAQNMKTFWTRTSYMNMAKDLCIASSFFNATLEWLQREESNWVSYE